MNRTEPDHPSEAALLTLLHHQPLAAKAELQSHLRFCEACRARMLYLSCREIEVGDLLAELDHPVPAADLDAILGRPGRRGLRRGTLVGAFALVIAAAAAAATLPGSPFREWARGRANPEPETPVPQASPRATQGGASGVSMMAPPELVVTLLRPQSHGVVDLTIRGEGTATVRSRGGSVAYQVGDGHIAIDNRTPADAYEIQVPSTVRKLVVLMGDRILVRKDGNAVTPTPGLDGGTHYRVSLDSGGAPIGTAR